MVGLGCGFTAGCGGTSKHAPDGGAGHDGSVADATAGRGDAADDSGAGASDAASGADAPDVGADVSDASDAGADVSDAVDAFPEIDAGVGCLSPGPEAALSPTAEGLPALGLVLWVRGDRGVYKTSQNEVCGWRDQAGEGRLLRPSGTRPTWQSATVGGQPGILFSVESQDLYTSGVVGIAPSSGRTFIAVSKLVNPTGRFHPILQGQGGTPGTYVGIDANTWQTAGSLEGAYVTNNSYDSALATSTSPRVHAMKLSTLVAGTAVTAALDYRVNGATQTMTLKAGSGTIVDFSGADFTTVGAVSGTPSAGAAGGTGIVAEAIIYDRALSMTEIVAIETVLEARYGIQ